MSNNIPHEEPFGPYLIEKLSKIEDNLSSIKEQLHNQEVGAIKELQTFQAKVNRDINDLEKNFAVFRTKVYVSIAILALILEVSLAFVPKLL